jgi:uncharacterized protein (UPF0333 family)
MVLKKKGDIEIDFLIKILLIFIFLVVMLFIFIILSGKGTGIIEHIKNLFSFGGGSSGGAGASG